MAAPEFTFFTTCKPFRGATAVQQRAALRSWARLGATCEVVVFGDEPGAAACCRELGLRHVAQIARSAWGTPRLDALFVAAEQEGRGQILVYANADLLLAADIPRALRVAADRFSRFLALVRRWNVPAEEFTLLADARPHEVMRRVRSVGTLEPLSGGVDVFAFPRGFWRETLPPFAVGRGRWDSGLILAARRQREPVVELTSIATAIHPLHGYEHLFGQGDDLSSRQEMRHNAHLLGGGAECIYSAVNATHIATSDGIRRFWPTHPIQAARRILTAAGLYRWLMPLVPLARLAGRIARFRVASGKLDRVPWHTIPR